MPQNKIPTIKEDINKTGKKNTLILCLRRNLMIKLVRRNQKLL
jgi:hypothetical protein